MNFEDVKHLTLDGQNAVRLAIGGGVVWKGLPKGYTQVDYIEVTGTQYINTGFVPNQDSRAVCEFLYAGGAGIFGARTTTTADNFNLRVISGRFQMGYGDNLGSTSIPADDQWHLADLNKNSLYMDGGTEPVRSLGYMEFTAPETFILGGINASNRVYYGEGRYRACQLYDNDILVRDLLPCKDPEGNAGMYDTVNAVFYGNAGTGEIIAGVEI